MKNKIKDFQISKVAYNDALTNYLFDNCDPEMEKNFNKNYFEEWIRLNSHKTAMNALYAAIEPRFGELQLISHDIDKCSLPTKIEHRLNAPHHMLCKPWSYSQCYLDSYTILEIALDIITAHYVKHECDDDTLPVPCHPSVPVSIRQLLVNTVEFVRLGLSRNLDNEISSNNRIFDYYPELKKFARNPQFKIAFICPESSIMKAGEEEQNDYENDNHVTHLIFALPGMGKTTAMNKLNLSNYFAVDFDFPIKGEMKANLRTDHMRRANSAYINQLAIQNCDFVFGWYDQIDFSTLDLSRIDIWVFMPNNVDFAINNTIKRVNGKKSKFNDDYIKFGTEWYNGWQKFISKMQNNPKFYALYGDYTVSQFITKCFDINMDDSILEGED